MPDPVRRTPQEKKRLSYDHDRRNDYGENDKSSRKNIPRSRRLGLMRWRHGVKQALSYADDPDAVASAVAEAHGVLSRKRFMKGPDVPLRAWLQRR